MQVESCVQDGKTVAVITGTETDTSLIAIERAAVARLVRADALSVYRKSLCRPAEAFFRFVRCLFVQIAGQQLLQQLIAVKAADETAGVVVVGDIRRIL